MNMSNICFKSIRSPHVQHGATNVIAAYPTQQQEDVSPAISSTHSYSPTSAD